MARSICTNCAANGKVATGVGERTEFADLRCRSCARGFAELAAIYGGFSQKRPSKMAQRCIRVLKAEAGAKAEREKRGRRTCAVAR